MQSRYFLALGLFVLLLASAHALVIDDVEAPTLSPGKEGTLRISIENTFSRDIEDVSISLNTQGLPLTIVGSSEQTIDEIEEDDEEQVSFILRASPTAEPGDYQVPFTLSTSNGSRARTGTIGVRIYGNVELAGFVNAQQPIIGQEGRVTLRVVNKGFADARYVSVSLVPEGFTVLSEKSVYIGDINANDFETATFDVLYTSKNPTIDATLEYIDFDNVRQTQRITESVKAYTREEAIEKGIIKKNNTPLYIAIVVVLLILWMIVRAIRRRRRLRKSMQNTSVR